MSDRCVLYWLCGDGGYAETLAVSIASLRKWWDGPVVIASGVADADSIRAPAALECLVDTFGVREAFIQMPKVRRHAKYVTKASLWRLLPERQVVYLDADTVVCGPLDRLWTDTIKLTQFSDWRTPGRKISGRLASARQHLEEPLWPAGHDRDYPAINTGVFAWGDENRTQVFLEEWEKLTLAGWRAPLTDELYMQMLVGRGVDLGILWILTDAYNWSPTYGKSPNPVIMHFHGRRHVRRQDGRELWEPHARQALADYPKLREWWGKFDPHGGHLL